MPKLMLRRKAGCWEPIGGKYFALFGVEYILHQALFQHRRFGGDLVQIGEDYLFIC